MTTAQECMASSEPCIFHRYGCVHALPGSDRVYDHSQGTWDGDLRGVEYLESFPSRLYEHGMTATELRQKFTEEACGGFASAPEHEFRENLKAVDEAPRGPQS